MRYEFNKKTITTPKTAVDYTDYIKSPENRKKVSEVMALLCALVNNMVDDSSWTVKFGANPKFGNMYVLVAHGDETDWINGSSFAELVDGLYARTREGDM